MAAPDAGNAEWIAEAPSACNASGTSCRTLPLANFGTLGGFGGGGGGFSGGGGSFGGGGASGSW